MVYKEYKIQHAYYIDGETKWVDAHAPEEFRSYKPTCYLKETAVRELDSMKKAWEEYFTEHPEVCDSTYATMNFRIVSRAVTDWEEVELKED